MSMITIIGRGHSGTRAISHTLSKSGVFMGEPLNKSGDLIPPDDIYEACSVMSKYVEYKGDYNWDFSRLHTMEIEKDFIELIESYLGSVLDHNSEYRGWKIPETTLVYPWIVRMFPDIKYILWYRDPRDVIMGGHVTDDLHDFGIPYPHTDNKYEMRAISWLYQWQIIKNTPAPANIIKVKFEDFILKQEETLSELEDFLGISLTKIPVRTDPVNRWQKKDKYYQFDFLEDAMQELNYLE